MIPAGLSGCATTSGRHHAIPSSFNRVKGRLECVTSDITLAELKQRGVFCHKHTLGFRRSAFSVDTFGGSISLWPTLRTLRTELIAVLSKHLRSGRSRFIIYLQDEEARVLDGWMDG